MNTKICQSCDLEKSLSDFPVRNDRSGRLRPYCKVCSNKAEKARYTYYRKSNPFVHRCTRAKTRAKSLGVPFDLTAEYLESIWTGICPVLGVSLNITTDRTDELAAELDRFSPEKGYVQGNVNFLSRKANRLKNNTSVKELEKLLNWMKKIDES